MRQSSAGEATLGMRPVTLDVALTPAPVEAGGVGGQATRFVVVDVVRATTTLSVVFEHGARAVYATRNIGTARTLRRDRAPDARLAGEQGGLPPEGFDFGNSPAEMTAARCAAQELVFATTNGTRALAACTHIEGARIYTGAFRNAAAVAAVCLADAPTRAATDGAAAEAHQAAGQSDAAERASEADVGDAPADVVVVCSGRGNRPAFDDTLCAGYLIAALLAESAQQRRPTRLAEGARIALATWQAFEQRQAKGAGEALTQAALRETLAETDAGRAVLRVGLGDDLNWCATRNATQLVPGVVRIDQQPLALMLVAHAPEDWLTLPQHL